MRGGASGLDQAEELAAAARYGADMAVIGSGRFLEVAALHRRREVLAHFRRT